MRGTALQTPRSVEKEEQGVLQRWSRDSPAVSAAHGVAAVPLQPREVHRGAHIPLQPVESSTLEQVRAKGGCDPWEARAGAGSWQRLWKSVERGAPPEQVCWQDLGPTMEQFVKNCSLREGCVLKFMEECRPWRGPHGGTREECEESSP